MVVILLALESETVSAAAGGDVGVVHAQIDTPVCKCRQQPTRYSFGLGHVVHVTICGVVGLELIRICRDLTQVIDSQ